MAIIQLAEPTNDETQQRIYNENIGGNLNRKVTFDSVAAGTCWAVVGCVLADAATPASVESTLVPAVTALTEVNSVVGDQLYGQIAASVAAGTQPVLNVTVTTTGSITAGTGTFSQVCRQHRTVNVPLNKKWVVLLCTVPAAMDQTSIAALKAAIGAIAGVTTVVHLIDGVVPTRSAAAAQVQVSTHVRIEPTV